MKVFVLLLAAFVLLNTCVSAEDKLDESAVPSKDQDNEEVGEHVTSDFDTENEVSEIGDEEDKNDKDDKEEKDGDSDTASKAKETEQGEAQVIKTQGLVITVGKGGKIGISLSGGRTSHKTVYTRWGSHRCRYGARLLYYGYMAGSHYSHKGSGANNLCMPRYPHYLSTTTPSAGYAFLYGTEYESANRIFSGRTQNYNPPCAVCQVQKSTKVTIPAKVRCPRGWTREYYGYLMAEHYGHVRSGTFECIDVSGGRISGSQRNTNGALLYFTRLGCGTGIPCGPYISARATTCVVCSA